METRAYYESTAIPIVRNLRSDREVLVRTPSSSPPLRAVVLFVPIFVITLVALRYAVLGPRGLITLEHADGLMAVLHRGPVDFFHGFVAEQLPRYQRLRAPLLLHIVAMAIALGVGAFQASAWFRRRHPRAHRRLGVVYASAALVGGTAGAYIARALPMHGDGWTVASNVVTGGLVDAFVVLALIALGRGRYAAHGRWMLRSYALVLTLVTLYVLIPIFVALGGAVAGSYDAAHLVCLPLNLVAVEVWLRRASARQT